MTSRGDLTDVEWAVLEPLLPSTNNRCGRWRDHRQVINGIFHRFSTGAQWRELPGRFGPWKTVHKRHLPWSADGTWESLLQHVQAQADAEGDIAWDINVDSTAVRAHLHAAGAPRAAPSASPGSSEKRAPRRSVRGADEGESAAPRELHGDRTFARCFLCREGQVAPLVRIARQGRCASARWLAGARS
ncbi:IS5 family transposase [Streptomyces smyrnaeus]